MPHDIEPMEVHLFNVSESEAQAAEEEHGSQQCSFSQGGQESCGKHPVLRMLLKQPGNEWGDGIKSASACETHRGQLERMINRIDGGSREEA